MDFNDYAFGFNSVLPYGDFATSSLALWNMRLKIETHLGDVILFLGRIAVLAVKAIVQDGIVRNVEDSIADIIATKYEDDNDPAMDQDLLCHLINKSESRQSSTAFKSSLALT